jgi:hypothetical protein
MERLLDALTSVEIEPIAIVDIVLTALLFYWLFSLIRGTRAVRLVIGVISLYVVYAAGSLRPNCLADLRPAPWSARHWSSSSAPELRRALERIGASARWAGSVGLKGRSTGGCRRPAAAQLSAIVSARSSCSSVRPASRTWPRAA